MSAVEVHPGILAERERWLRGNKRYCPQLARDDLHRRRFGDDPDCPLCGGVGWTPPRLLPIALLPAVPPAELRAGDVVVGPDAGSRNAVRIKGVEHEERWTPLHGRRVEWVLVEAVGKHWLFTYRYRASERLRVLREVQP